MIRASNCKRSSKKVSLRLRGSPIQDGPNFLSTSFYFNITPRVTSSSSCVLICIYVYVCALVFVLFDVASYHQLHNWCWNCKYWPCLCMRAARNKEEDQARSWARERSPSIRCFLFRSNSPDRCFQPSSIDLSPPKIFPVPPGCVNNT